jgi:integrase
MTTLRLPYVHAFRDRHGSARYYFRFKGKRWPLPTPGEPGFMAAYEAVKKAVSDNPTSAVANVHFLSGTLGWAIEKFTGDRNYLSRAENTRRNERRTFDLLRKKYGAGMLKDLTSRHVKLIRDDIRETHSVADVAVGLLSVIWVYADEHLDLDLTVNPTVGVRRVHRHGKGHQPWPMELLERFMCEAPPPLAFACRLAIYTGQRRSDVVKMKWSQFDGSLIEVRQQKTDELLAIPCHRALCDELKSMPRLGEAILIGERGRSLKASSLGVLVRRALNAMGVSGYSIHGLRKNAAQALAEAGCSDREIMAITGHRTTEMVSLYTRRAEQKRMARSAMDKLEARPAAMAFGRK